jgi:hypothetical protein
MLSGLFSAFGTQHTGISADLPPAATTTHRLARKSDPGSCGSNAVVTNDAPSPTHSAPVLDSNLARASPLNPESRRLHESTAALRPTQGPDAWYDKESEHGSMLEIARRLSVVRQAKSQHGQPATLTPDDMRHIAEDMVRSRTLVRCVVENKWKCGMA